jgi:hypothetical protein
MTQTRTGSNPLIDTMTCAVTIASVDAAMRRDELEPIQYVTLSAEGEHVIFPLVSGASVALEPRNRVTIRHDDDGCALYLDERLVQKLDPINATRVGPINIRISATRKEAELGYQERVAA